MAGPARKRREKISVTLDPTLLRAVDLYLQRHKDLDRSKVMDAALTQWYGARQDEAMVEQFGEPAGERPEEQKAWRAVRRSAATRKLNRGQI